MREYKSYPFRGRDPILRKTLILMDGHKASEISKKSTVSTSTFHSWRKKTRRPQFATIAAVWGAFGRKSVPISGD